MQKTSGVKNGYQKVMELAKGQFVRNLLTLVTGTTIAQSIPVITSPILTRLYSPSEFGLFSVFTAISGIIIVFICGKYELAMLLPKKKKDAANVMALSILIAIIISISSFVFFAIFKNWILRLINSLELGNWILLIPVYTLLYSFYVCFNEWCVRNEYFKYLSRNKITNTSAISGSSIIFGLFRVLNGGLILGQVVGQLVSSFTCIMRVLKSDKEVLKEISIRKIKYFSKKYVDFPKYSIPSQLLNTVASQLPALFIVTFFGSSEAGYFALTIRVLSIPAVMVAMAFGDVFRQRASIQYTSMGNCAELFKNTIKFMTIFSLIAFGLLFIIAPVLFSILFGDAWGKTGYYVRILCPMIMFNFIGTSIGSIFYITQSQKVLLAWQILFSIITIIGLYLGTIVFNDVSITLWMISIGWGFANVIYIFLAYNISKGRVKKLI